MTLTPAATHLLRTARDTVQYETDARAELAATLTSGQQITGSLFQDVLTYAAHAAPWRDVLRLADRVTLAAALTAVREKTARTLLEEGESVSTSALTNEERRVRREALRAFLRSTETAADRLQDEEAAATASTPDQERRRLADALARHYDGRPLDDLRDEHATHHLEAAGALLTTPPTPTPAPPTPASTPPRRRPTKAQHTVLQVIATGQVIIREARVGQTRAFGPDGPLNIATVHAVVRNGWALVDTSTSLYRGQAVTLTDTGRPHLPA